MKINLFMGKISIILTIIFLNTLVFAQENNAKELRKKATEKENLGKFDESISLYQKVIELDPNNYYLYYKVGQLYENLSGEHKYDFKKSGDKYDPMDPYLEKAIEYYQKGLGLLPEDKKTEVSPLGELWWSYQIPFIYRLTGDFAKELAFYKKYYETTSSL